MNPIQGEIDEKKSELKKIAVDLRSCTINIKDDLETDSRQIKKVAIAYEHSGNLIKRTNDALDRVLAQSEVRTAIYVAGVIIMIGVLIWKLTLAT